LLVREQFSIVRIDVMVWKRDVTSKSLQSIVDNVSAFVYSKSSVNLENIKSDTLFAQFTPLVEAAYPDVSLQVRLAKTGFFIDEILTLNKAISEGGMANWAKEHNVPYGIDSPELTGDNSQIEPKKKEVENDPAETPDSDDPKKGKTPQPPEPNKNEGEEGK